MQSTGTKSNEEKLKILLEWKKLYTEALINALQPTETVLEVGFGIGLAAECINKYHPKTHVIIESDPHVLKEAKKWADKHPNTKIIEGNWESVLVNLGSFDAIFFNDYPLEDDMGIMNFLFPEDNRQISSEAKKTLGDLEEQMTNITTRFSDQDIEDFYQKTGKHNMRELSQFFLKLKDSGNISQMQYENSIKKYRIKDIPKISKDKPKEVKKKPDPMLLFLEKCLKNNLKKGSRFSCFLNSQTSKYDDAMFFDHIITNPDVDYKETPIPIKMSDQPRNALILLIQKS